MTKCPKMHTGTSWMKRRKQLGVSDILECFRHGDLTGKLGKCIQYEINDLGLCGRGFHVPDIFVSSHTVHNYVKVVHAPALC